MMGWPPKPAVAGPPPALLKVFGYTKVTAVAGEERVVAARC
jgi:hypothetical protein